MAVAIPSADPARWHCVLPALPKRQSRGRANGLCAGVLVGTTVGTGWRESPCWWPRGVPTPIVVEGHKHVEIRGVGGRNIAGFWNKGNGEAAGALGWRLQGESLALRSLHPAQGWAWTRALGAGGDCHVGYGAPIAPRGTRVAERALCWSDEGRLVELPALESDGKAIAMATDGRQVAGYAIHGGGQRAVLWPVDGSDAVMLGDLQSISEAWAVADGEQVGFRWGGGGRGAASSGARAALWRGSAASFVDLTPPDAEDARALGCGHGYQVGYTLPRRTLRSGAANSLTRAALWAGDAGSWLDLHALLPAPWNASSAVALSVIDGQLLIVGEAQQIVIEHEATRNESQFQAARVPILWSTALT